MILKAAVIDPIVLRILGATLRGKNTDKADSEGLKFSSPSSDSHKNLNASSVDSAPFSQPLQSHSFRMHEVGSRGVRGEEHHASARKGDREISDVDRIHHKSTNFR